MKLYFVVKRLLTNSPELRDSDKKLIWQVWEDTGFTVGQVISKDQFMEAPHTESIRRLRQKLQEDHSELRSSEGIQKVKDEKQEMAGNFVYQEKVEIKPRVTWDAMKKQLEDLKTAERLKRYTDPIDKRKQK